ncbi:MAG: GPR endopeptidase [Christensenellaceae bacterium]|jgi:spore protease|nr:GPR endopeptidase [Christensenellaceae bacterium]
MITDLAIELIKKVPKDNDGLTHIKIATPAQSKAVGKPIGNYVNITKNFKKNLQIALKLFKIKGKILIVGLGNDRFIADSLGPKTLTMIEAGRNTATFEPNVRGITGIDSTDAIRAIVDLVKPKFAIILDSLVSFDAEKIGCNYQITDTGITPGSGIRRNNKELNKVFLGCNVISIGVPVCTIIEKVSTTSHKRRIFRLVPSDIDQIIDGCAINIADAINGRGK